MTTQLGVTLFVETETVLLDDGRSFPVSNWLDWNGNECGPEDAAAFVAGEGDVWISGMVETAKRPARLN